MHTKLTLHLILRSWWRSCLPKQASFDWFSFTWNNYLVMFIYYFVYLSYSSDIRLRRTSHIIVVLKIKFFNNVCVYSFFYKNICFLLIKNMFRLTRIIWDMLRTVTRLRLENCHTWQILRDSPMWLYIVQKGIIGIRFERSVKERSWERITWQILSEKNSVFELLLFLL